MRSETGINSSDRFSCFLKIYSKGLAYQLFCDLCNFFFIYDWDISS
jgi:hypothetical protein